MGAFDGLRRGQATHGYWGKHTSSIDWCEINYEHTPYVAEFINTITNVPVISAGIYGAIATVRGGVAKRYSLLYLGLSLIGIGSFGFHASLRWEWQLLDELPMIYVVSFATYLVWDTRPTFDFLFGIFGPLLVIAWCLFVTFSYIYLPNPIYHQVAFAFILLSAVTRNAVLLRRIPSTHPSRKLIGKTLLKGSLIFAIGFGIWNLDNIFCSEFRSTRDALYPYAIWLDGHGIWHLMTGYGSLLIFAAAIYLSLAIKTSPDTYAFDGDAWFPIVKAKTPSERSSKDSKIKLDQAKSPIPIDEKQAIAK
ncbi:ceramidase [Kockovaella imperatae]|uniref:Ceramidase n=1 Tax=Kockovaella imperatae TaxID=4999 RepID=A0A1Y1UQA0_9TREE|nr:ceramidase [Kockovaella imperatae]ORX40203.1 ceramidase [Kockovaella imperatae]